MEYLTLGVLAHVDAGKTTLCERLLFKNNTIKSFGRVDKNESFLDYEPIERKRGITIFSKQAILNSEKKSVTLLDTPGHSDFVWETLSCISVMDAALLIVDRSSPISAYTLRLYRLLKENLVPTMVFLNKSDMDGDYTDSIIEGLKKEGAHPVFFGSKNYFEEIALCREDVLEKYIETGDISKEEIKELYANRLFSPIFCGSALKDEGVEELNDFIFSYISPSRESEIIDFFPYKIRYDNKNSRLVYGKVLKPFKVKDVLLGEKIEEIRLYNGEKGEQINEAFPGMLVALRGPERIKAKNINNNKYIPLIEYEIILPETEDIHVFAEKLKPLGEEHSELAFRYDPQKAGIVFTPMGDIQLEILKDIINVKLGVDIDFRKTGVIYKETIVSPVEGVGHFEPLRHYAEVHLLLSPNHGKGMEIDSNTPPDVLAVNWQSQVIETLKEIAVPGVLIGAALTDIKITLVSGKSHIKHTEGGDFREATLRALRQGLMSAENILLEPVYAFEIRLPSDCLGKLMVRLESMNAVSNSPEYLGEEVIINGRFPVSKLSDFPVFVTSLTSGAGDLSLEFDGYMPCEKAAEIIDSIGYNPQRDIDFPADSVFTSHGGSDVVYWKDVPERMHLPFVTENSKKEDYTLKTPLARDTGEMFIGLEEIEAILNSANGANRRRTKSDRRSHWNRYSKASSQFGYNDNYKGTKSDSDNEKVEIIIPEKPKEYLLVDGYNIIFAWTDLKELSDINMDSAKELLCDILDEYAAFKEREVIVVFDAYRVNNGIGSVTKWGGIDVVHTKEAETADSFIERTAHDISKKYKVFVATSDRLEQMIVRGEGAFVLSATDFLKEIKDMEDEIRRLL